GIGMKTSDKSDNLVAGDAGNIESFHDLSNILILSQTCANKPSADLLRSQTSNIGISQMAMRTQHQHSLSTPANRASYQHENGLRCHLFFRHLLRACCFAGSDGAGNELAIQHD